MSLTDQILSDNEQILSNTNDFAITVIYNDQSTGSIEISAIYNSVSREIEANTGLPIIVNNPSLSISWSVINKLLTDGIISQLPTKNSKFTVTYAGNTRELYVSRVDEDRQLNMINYKLYRG